MTETAVTPQSVDDILTAGLAEMNKPADETGEAASPGEDDGQPAAAPEEPTAPPPSADELPGAAPAEPAEPDPLSPEDKIFLETLPLRHQQRAKEWTRNIKRGAQEKFDQAAEARREIETIDGALAPFSADMRQSGTTRAQVVTGALGYLHRLQNDPAGEIVRLVGAYRHSATGAGQAEEFVRRLAAELGVKIGTQGQDAQVPPGQPETAEARRIAALEAKIAGQERAQKEAEERQLRQLATSAEGKIQEFAKDKAAHPHFDKVRRTVGVLMQDASDRGELMTLDQAYQRAIWAHDELRPDLIKAQQAEAAKAAAATQRESIAKARAAGTPRTANVAVADVNNQSASVEALLDRGRAELGID